MLLFLCCAAGPDFWAEPSLAHLSTGGARSEAARQDGRLYAAKGEYESFQLYVSGGGKGRKGLRLETEAVDERIPAPRVYRVQSVRNSKPSSRSTSSVTESLDALIPADLCDLASKETAAFWVTYAIPSDAEAGVRLNKIRIVSEGRRTETLEVRLEVFDFTLPAIPHLSSLASMDRLSMRSVYGLSETDLEQWKPVYDVLGRYPLPFKVWDGGGLAPLDRAGVADTAVLKRHLDYILSRGRVSMVELGGDALTVFPEPAPGQTIDPMQAYLRDMTAWLAEKSGAGLGCVAMEIPARRGDWAGVREQCSRVGKADDRLPRLLVGPPHPYFDRYVDRWAIPLRSFSPELIFRFQHGLSLSDTETLPLKRVQASSFGALPGGMPGSAAFPEEACDGSAYSGWAPMRIPTSREPEWLTLYFSSPVTANSIQILWAPECPIQPVEVSTSFDGEFFNQATIRWQQHPPQPFLFGVSSGTFRYESTFVALRLMFHGSAAKGPVGILEVRLDRPESPPPPEPVPSVQPWLQVVPESFPSLSVAAHPMESRGIPWICWGHGFTGVVLPPLNHWPRAWLTRSNPSPGPWMDGEKDSAYLVYPAAQELAPSVRLERLRDGFEDYEYLWLLDQALRDGTVSDKKLDRWAQHRAYRLTPSREELDAMSGQVQDARLEIGRALSKALGAGGRTTKKQ